MERGQATVEWIGLLLLVSILGLAGTGLGPSIDGRSFGGFLSHRIVCAVDGGCDDGDADLARVYGKRRAALVRGQAPNLVYEPGEPSLPVDWRFCRAVACSRAPDERDLDAHRTNDGDPATVFTRVVRRHGRLYLTYWLYYPDSNSTVLGADKLWERSRLLPLAGQLFRGTPDWPGYHDDDWEAYVVRIDPDGRVWARASAHGHWQGCKSSACHDRWMRSSGWTRVSRGSHAGHIPGDLWTPPLWGGHRRGGFRPSFPGRGLRERSSTSEGLRLIPLETIEHGDYRPLDPKISPPWRKPAWSHPERGRS